ncbi:unnamed protein product [Wickerhamomyces anomalus]
MEKEQSQDDFIRERLSHNFEAYTNNAILNKLTPSRSLGRASSVQSSSRKSDSSWGKKYPKRNDSNIVTSPVKTLRQFGAKDGGADDGADDDDDEYDTTTNYDDDNSKKDSTTVNVPLQSSPKKPLRKGTPKEIDDDGAGAGGAHLHSDNTLLSEIPSDILSPEKHIYPQENLRRSSSNIPSATKVKDATTSLLSKSFSVFSPPPPKHKESKTTGKSPTSGSKRRESPSKGNRGESLPPSLYPKVRLFGDDDDDEASAPKKLTSDVTDSKVVEEVRESLSIRKKRESEAITMFFDRSSSSSKAPEKQSIISPRSKESNTRPNLFERTTHDTNSSFHTLNEFIKNPLIDDAKYKTTNVKHSDKKTPNNEPTEPTNTTTQRKSFDISQFESSDEEPVPELTVPLNEEPQPTTTKRVYDEPIETSTNKKPKTTTTTSLYPTIQPTSQTPLKRSSETRRRSLYPTLPSVGHPSRVSAADIEDISNNISETTKPKPQAPLPKEPEEKEEDLGDSDHWVKNQWACFFKAFKRYKKTNDLSIFQNKRLLEYLRCDEHEIKLKIQFTLDHEHEIKRKNK